MKPGTRNFEPDPEASGRNPKPATVDVVYVLGTGSRWGDNEIRFSLRSLEKNLTGMGNVFVVGECPAFLQNVIHIPAPDVFDPAVNADGNIINKVLAACADERISDNFLFINDDHMILHPITASEVPMFHKGDMTTFDSDFWKFNYWRTRLKRTMQVLKQMGFSTFHYDCHAPMLFNRQSFENVMQYFDYSTAPGLTMKSLYGNATAVNGVRLTTEKRTIFRHYKLAEIRPLLQQCRFMSYNDAGLNNSLKWWLMETFPTQSRFEKSLPTEILFELYNWQATGKTWEMGVEIFKNYFKNPHLQDLFDEKETPALRTKLEFKLQLTINEL
jgi:hypothetical protein